MSKDGRAGVPKKLGPIPADQTDLHTRSPSAVLQNWLQFVPIVEIFTPGAVTAVSLLDAPGRIPQVSVGLASLYVTMYVVKPVCKATGSVLEQWIRRWRPREPHQVLDTKVDS